MDAEQFRRVMVAFAEVCDLPPDQRHGVLTALSADDTEIGREVQRLLEAERQGSGRLEPLPFAGGLPESGPPAPEAGGSLSGTQIAQFEVGERIGCGGMGEVYVGVDTVLRRKVALKAIRHDQRMSEAARRRFLREARMLSSLDHPNICRIHDYLRGEEEDFLVLELIQGQSLRTAAAEGLSSTEALSITKQVADALAAAHSEGVVHRDLSLSNVMLTANGTAKILDFGLARPAESEEIEGRLGAVGDLTTSVPGTGAFDHSIQFRTTTGLVAGTPSAMSPEQIAGRPASAASDMYSFGLLAQELFTGEPPYDPALTPSELIDAARQGATRPVSGVDRHVAGLIKSLTALQTRTRPTAPEVVAQLRWIRDKPKRWLRHAATAAIVAIFALGGLKYTLDLRRERAVADQRREQAEGLIGFMLGDLRTKLGPLGRLDVLDDIGDKALDYFASVPEAELSDAELLSRAKALTQIGEVRISQHRYDEAFASFEEAYRHSAALAARKPEDGDVLFDRGQAEYWVGYVYWRRLEGEQAHLWMERYRDTSKALLELDTTRDDWVLEVAYAHHNLAVLALEFGQLEKADEGFTDELRVLQSLLEGSPDAPTLVGDLADAYSWLGTTARRRGLLERSHEYFSESAKQRRTLVEADPDNATHKFSWAQAMIFEGDIAAIRGYREESVEIYGSAIAVLEEQVASDPTNREWLRILATAKVAQVNPLAADEGPGRVEDQLGSARAVLQRLVASEAGDRLARRTLGLALRLTARLERHPHTGVETIARAVDFAEELHNESAHDPELLGDLAACLVLAGELQQAAGNEEAARSSWQRARELLTESVEGSSFAGLLDPWARTLANEGRMAESQAIIRTLRLAGYEPIWRW